MNAEELAKLTPEEKRIRIAELCGLKFKLRDTTGWRNEKDEVIPLPDYLNDLNAMHEAEEMLPKTKGAPSTYCRELEKLCAPFNSQEPYLNSFLWHASATQRADAFLLSLS